MYAKNGFGDGAASTARIHWRDALPITAVE
jgi:hypothetical protein